MKKITSGEDKIKIILSLNEIGSPELEKSFQLKLLIILWSNSSLKMLCQLILTLNPKLLLQKRQIFVFKEQQ